MSDFANHKSFTVDPHDLRGFTGGKRRWNCNLCGHNFVLGDTVRWVEGSGEGNLLQNFFICDKCDGPEPEVIAKAKDSFQLARKLAKQWGIYGPDWYWSHD